MAKKPGLSQHDALPLQVKALVQQLDLQSIRLVNSSSYQQVKEGPLPSLTDVGADVEVSLADNEMVLRIRPSLSVVIRYDEDDSDATPAISVTARYQMMYVSQSPLKSSREALTAFGMDVSLFSIWPYWREFVQNNLARMGLPIFTVPLLKREQAEPVQPIKKEQSARKSRTKRRSE